MSSKTKDDVADDIPEDEPLELRRLYLLVEAGGYAATHGTPEVAQEASRLLVVLMNQNIAG
jgi:hypothetical protein